MNKKIFYPAICIVLISVLNAIIIQGCKPAKTLASPKYIIGIMPVVRMDTPRTIIPRRALTAVELKNIVRPFFQMNIDTFISPKFDKLSSAIDNQAKSISTLTNLSNDQSKNITQLISIVTDLRIRSIKRSDSINKVRSIDRAEFNKLQNFYLKYQSSQINDIKGIINFLIAVGALMFLSLITLFILAWIFYRKLIELYNLYKQVLSNA